MKNIVEATLAAIIYGLIAFIFELPWGLWLVMFICFLSAALFFLLPWPHQCWRQPKNAHEIKYVINFKIFRVAFLVALIFVGVVTSLAGYSAAKHSSTWLMGRVTSAFYDHTFIKEAKIVVTPCVNACSSLVANTPQDSTLYFIAREPTQASTAPAKEMLDTVTKRVLSEFSDGMVALIFAFTLLGWIPLLAFELQGNRLFAPSSRKP